MQDIIHMYTTRQHIAYSKLMLNHLLLIKKFKKKTLLIWLDVLPQRWGKALVDALPHVRNQSVKLLKTKYTNQFATQCAQIVYQIKLQETHYTQFPKCRG